MLFRSVRDGFGCYTSCTVTLTVAQPPTCVITPAATCPTGITLLTGTAQQFCVAVTPGANELAANLTTTVTKNGNPFAGPFTGTQPNICFTVNAPDPGVTDTYVATVVDTALGGACTTTCSACLTGRGVPRIRVTKEIVCVLCGADGCAPFTGAKTATGARGDTCPAFCYRVTIENLSDAGISLNNLAVTDVITPSTEHNLPVTGAFPASLTPVGTAGATATRDFPNIPHCVDTRNVVTANADGVTASGTAVGHVSASDTNNALVLNLGVECTKYLSVDGAPRVSGANGNCVTESDGNSHTLTYSVVIHNSGEVPEVVTISDTVLAGLGAAFPSNTVNLAAGASVDLTATSVTVPCNTNINNTVNVTAVVDTSSTTICVCDTNHIPVSVKSACSACYSCSTPQPASCRTTGGGKQDQTGQRAGLVPNVDPRANPLVAKYVTHGGQVGAPVGTSTEWTPCSPCIKGEWEHVRHFRPGLDGNFHARHFDSLQCACLPCEGDPGSGVITPGKKGGLCNAGDRVCGPEPRRAPANKMCFSGIGDYAVTNGRRVGQSVVFRVDIEDHGEPGGAGPKGNKRLPADRYRIRIWKVSSTAVPLAQACTSNIDLRKAIACTEANTSLRDGTTDPLAPRGVTTALGSPVFGVRAPDIDDGGELDRGNRQIHPQIKTCTP